MAEENKNIDHLFSEKLSGAKITPPSLAWQQLQPKLPIKTQKRRFFWWIFSGLLLLLSSLFFVLFEDQKESQITHQQILKPKIKEANATQIISRKKDTKASNLKVDTVFSHTETFSTHSPKMANTSNPFTENPIPSTPSKVNSMQEAKNSVATASKNTPKLKTHSSNNNPSNDNTVVNEGHWLKPTDSDHQKEIVSPKRAIHLEANPEKINALAPPKNIYHKPPIKHGISSKINALPDSNNPKTPGKLYFIAEAGLGTANLTPYAYDEAFSTLNGTSIVNLNGRGKLGYAINSKWTIEVGGGWQWIKTTLEGTYGKLSPISQQTNPNPSTIVSLLIDQQLTHPLTGVNISYQNQWNTNTAFTSEVNLFRLYASTGLAYKILTFKNSRIELMGGIDFTFFENYKAHTLTRSLIVYTDTLYNPNPTIIQEFSTINKTIGYKTFFSMQNHLNFGLRYQYQWANRWHFTSSIYSRTLLFSLRDDTKLTGNELTNDSKLLFDREQAFNFNVGLRFDLLKK